MATLLQARTFSCLIIMAMAARYQFAADAQWSREFFPANGSQINAMLASPDGKFFYGGKSLQSDNPTTYALVVMQQGDDRMPIGVDTLNTGSVYALAMDGDILYAGGEFRSLSSYAVTNLARWDGVRWKQVGGGVTGGAVRAISVHNGELYIGGAFTNAGGLAVGGLARWDGTQWSSPGAAHAVSTYSEPVQAFQWIGDSLFVGGCFDSIGGIAATNIAEYVNGAWHPLANGVDQSSDWRGSGIHALAANTSGELFVVGGFSQAGETSAGYVAKWDGAHWSPLNQGIGRDSSALVDAVYCVGNDVYVGGAFWTLDGTRYDRYGGIGLARWNGANWTIPDAPLYGNVTAITADAGNLYVAGPISSPVDLHVPYQQPTSITRFDGSRWYVSGDAKPPVMAGTMANGKLRIAGDREAGGDFHNIADWDGVNWTVIGKVKGRLTRKLLHKDGMTYAIGDFYSINDVICQNIAAFDGAHWQGMGDGTIYPSCIEFVGTNLFIGNGARVHRWNGNGWEDLFPPAVGSVSAMAPDGDVLYVAVNDFPTTSEIVRWDGQQWSTLSFQGKGPVYSLCVADHRLYAGGGFNEVAGAPAKMLAAWDGIAWRELGGGITEGDQYNIAIRALEPDNEGGLFVGGYFTKLGNTPANNVAQWDGEEWRSLGKGVGGLPYDLHIDGRRLYIFGEIAIAGGRPSFGIAKWNIADLELIPRAVSTDNTFTFEVRGLPGKSFVLQKSPNLQQWQNVSTNTLTAKKLTLTDQSLGADSKFLRLLSAE